MYRFAWSKEVLNYLQDNVGLVNQLELAFADLRKSATGMPPYGVVDEGIGTNRYLWHIHDHTIRLYLDLRMEYTCATRKEAQGNEQINL